MLIIIYTKEILSILVITLLLYNNYIVYFAVQLKILVFNYVFRCSVQVSSNNVGTMYYNTADWIFSYIFFGLSPKLYLNTNHLYLNLYIYMYRSM